MLHLKWSRRILAHSGFLLHPGIFFHLQGNELSLLFLTFSHSIVENRRAGRRWAERDGPALGISCQLGIVEKPEMLQDLSSGCVFPQRQQPTSLAW